MVVIWPGVVALAELDDAMLVVMIADSESDDIAADVEAGWVVDQPVVVPMGEGADNVPDDAEELVGPAESLPPNWDGATEEDTAPSVALADELVKFG